MGALGGDGLTDENEGSEMPPAVPDRTGKLADGRAVHEKAERKVDWKAFGTLSAAGIICGVCMWVAFSWVGQTVDLESLVGAIFGGWLAGVSIFALT